MTLLNHIAKWIEAISVKVHTFTWSGRQWDNIMLDVSAIAIATVAVIIVVQYRSKINLRDRLKLTQELIHGLRSADKIEDNLNYILSVISHVVVAPYYSFYIWDNRAERYMLRSVSHPYDKFEGVGPAYSGIALPKKEVYLPPSTLENPPTRDVFSITKDGEVPLAVIRIGKIRGLVRLGPVVTITRRQRRHLVELASLLEGAIDDYVNLEFERVKTELRTLSDAAINKVASLASNTFAPLQVLLQAFTGIVGGKGGIFIQHESDGAIRLHGSESLLSRTRGLEFDLGAITQLEAMVVNGSERIITRADGEFYDLPVSLTSYDDVSAVVLVPFQPLGLLIMIHDEHYTKEQWDAIGSSQLRLLTDQVQSMLQQADSQRVLSKGYTRLLCQIADMVDNLNPYTVGYSDMMTHYSLAIGKELGLTDTEMRDLALAARLSNIGLIGMDMRLLMKEGQYSDFEYSLMKRHCEISASMIEIVTGNRRAANYVLYHHERVDGNGYPTGLRGNMIPVGAQIIHTVQVFLAKVNGRAWRSPQSFEQAMQELRNSMGYSLDAEVVKAFESWWSKKGASPSRAHTNLGKCHEMCCVPKSICKSCPALSDPYHCWDMPENHCKAHGRDCSTCFVRTEFLYRTKMAK